LIGPGVVLAGTTRRDGSARISGVEPLIMDGELWLSMMPASTKARDLERDPRILLHSIVTSRSPQAEIMVPLASSRFSPRMSMTSPTSGMTPRQTPSMWPAGRPVKSTSADP
jgi:hypothetical protein